LDRFNFLKPVKDVSSTILSPLQTVTIRVGDRTSNFFDFFRSRKKLTEENNALEVRVGELLMENARLDRQFSEAGLLNQEKLFLEEKNYSAVQARVVARSVTPYDNILTLNRGSNEGVRVGQPVIVQDGILIGKISSVHAHISQMSVITDSVSQVAVRIQNESGSLGILKGSHGLSVHVELIPQNEAVASGQAVLTSGSENLIPPDLLVGMTDVISRTEGELFQTATVTLPTDVKNVSIVSIISL
jgi:rod shape-determining protein MreC